MASSSLTALHIASCVNCLWPVSRQGVHADLLPSSSLTPSLFQQNSLELSLEQKAGVVQLLQEFRQQHQRLRAKQQQLYETLSQVSPVVSCSYEVAFRSFKNSAHMLQH